jgi:hypothetical protein
MTLKTPLFMCEIGVKMEVARFREIENIAFFKKECHPNFQDKQQDERTQVGQTTVCSATFETKSSLFVNYFLFAFVLCCSEGVAGVSAQRVIDRTRIHKTSLLEPNLHHECSRSSRNILRAFGWHFFSEKHNTSMIMINIIIIINI